MTTLFLPPFLGPVRGGALRGAPLAAVFCVVLGLPSETAAQAMAPPDGLEPELASFLRGVSEGAGKFADVDSAIADGYRKLGPDFPGMGEHWIHPSLVISGELDPRRPPVISYTTVDSQRRLVGFAFTRVTRPGESPPEGPFPLTAWHDHTGAVDEESLLLSGPASAHGHGAGHRLSMVHVWLPFENPDGVLSQNNWALPFLRIGLPAPEGVSSEAARALSLAGSGSTFYEELLRVGIGLDEEEMVSAMEAMDATTRTVKRWLDANRGQGVVEAADLRGLEEAWTELWNRLAAVLSEESYRAAEVLRAGS